MKKYSAFNRFIQRIAASRFGAWYFANTEHHVDHFFLRLSNGRMTLTSLLSGMPVMWLTVKGAKTGLLRSLPLLYIRDEDNPNIIALVAANWGKDRRPGWYYNLKANPHAQGSIRGQMQKYIAHEAEGDEYIKYWQAANQTYLGFAHYQQRINEGRLPILVLNPVV